MHYGLLFLALVGAPTIASAQVAHHAPARSVARSARAPAAKAAPLPVFSFLGDDTETVTGRTTLNNAKCDAKGGVLDCTDYSDPTVAGKRMDFLWMKYNGGKLYSVFASMKQYAYADVLAAFVAKYGKPASTGTRKWQSKGGASFDDEVTIWKFKGGELELDSMGLDTSSASFSFTSSANAPAADKPKVDF